MAVLVVGVALPMQAGFDTPRQKRHGGTMDTLLGFIWHLMRRPQTQISCPRPNAFTDPLGVCESAGADSSNEMGVSGFQGG